MRSNVPGANTSGSCFSHGWCARGPSLRCVTGHRQCVIPEAQSSRLERNNVLTHDCRPGCAAIPAKPDEPGQTVYKDGDDHVLRHRSKSPLRPHHPKKLPLMCHLQHVTPESVAQSQGSHLLPEPVFGTNAYDESPRIPLGPAGKGHSHRSCHKLAVDQGNQLMNSGRTALLTRRAGRSHRPGLPAAAA